MNRKHVRRLTGFLVVLLFFAGISYLIREIFLIKDNLKIIDYNISDEFYINDTITASVLIRNTGNENIKGPFKVVWLPNINERSRLIKTKFEIDTLNAGAEELITFSNVCERSRGPRKHLGKVS